MSQVLIVSPVPFLPCIAGNRARILALLRAVRAQGHQVSFVYLNCWRKDPADPTAMATEVGADGYFEILAHPRVFHDGELSISRRIMRKLGLQASFNYGLDDWFDDAIVPQLRAIADRVRADVAIVEYVFMSAAFAAFNDRCLTILDTHDLFADRSRKRTADGKRLAWYSTSPADEARGFRRADAIIAIQPDEACKIRSVTGETFPIRTISHFIPEMPPQPAKNISAGTYFSAANEPGIAGYHHLIGAILPRLRAEMPNFTLYVGGGICDALACDDRVTLVGQVADPADLYALAPLSLNPVQVGTGINIKLLESLGAGRPVVCYAAGARGVDDTYGEAILIANDDPADFARTILDALADPIQLKIRAKAAHEAAAAWNRAQKSELAALLALAD